MSVKNKLRSTVGYVVQDKHDILTLGASYGQPLLLTVRGAGTVFATYQDAEIAVLATVDYSRLHNLPWGERTEYTIARLKPAPAGMMRQLQKKRKAGAACR